jgi:DNA invertase Pin-like site-specific DNA recombinase
VARRRRRLRHRNQTLNTTNPGGRLVYHVFGALDEFIRELIVERTNEGLASGQRPQGAPRAAVGQYH